MEIREEEDTMAKSAKAAGCRRKHARLHSSFLHLSNALKKKLHGRRAHANATGEPLPPSSSSTSAATTSSFLSGCMHPRTHSFASGRRRHSGHAAAGRCSPGNEDDYDALAVDFRSLRVGGTAEADAAVADRSSSSSSSSAAKGYYTDGGSDEEGEAVPPPPANKAVAGGAGVEVVTFSAAPYEDFRRSMREMVDAAAEIGGGGAAPAVDWDLMEELLFCYLHLNDRAVHKDILRAFTDTVAALRRRRRAAAKSRRRTRRWGAREDGRDDGAEEAVPSS